jgi:acyl-coenzyme A synthetase/AMP-(fatty) acid ligase
MGDLGYMDDDSRLWFCGRKSHRLRTSQGTRATVPVENIYNTHPRVVRTALVGVGPEGEQLSVLCVQPTAGSMPKGKAMTLGFRDQLKAIGRKHLETAEVETFLFHPEFPVDPRHNAKIEREQLQAWASEQLH